jgi:hypothetical protein
MVSKKEIFYQELMKYSDKDSDITNQWTILMKKKGEQNCICGHTIKHFAYVYNIKTGHILIIGVGCCKKYGLNETVSNMLLIDFLGDTEAGSLLLKNGFFDLNRDFEFVQFLDNILNEIYKMNKENLAFYSRKIEVFKQNLEELIGFYNFYLGEKYLRKIDEIAEKIVVNESELVLTESIVNVDEVADEVADVANDVVDEVANEVANDVVDEVANDVVDEVVADDVVDEVADDVVANEVADEVANEVADEVADEVANEVVDEVVDEVVNEDLLAVPTESFNDSLIVLKTNTPESVYEVMNEKDNTDFACSNIRRLRNITKSVREVRKEVEGLNEKLREHRRKIDLLNFHI